MKNKYQLKLLSFFFIVFLLVFGFYKFMTYDRSYIWSKEYYEKMEFFAEENGLKIESRNELAVKDIKRSKEKKIKIKIQKALSGIKMMNYGHEFGESILLRTENKVGYLNCKGWCLDDHLIGLELEYNNIDSTTLETFKSNLDKQFENYEIIWTAL